MKSAHLAIRQNRFEPVPYLNAILVILYRVQDQNPAIGPLAPNTPFLEQIDGIALDVRAIQRVHRYQGDLGVSFLVDLPASVINLRNRVRVKNMREVIYVACGL